jgi:hypothetical protein
LGLHLPKIVLIPEPASILTWKISRRLPLKVHKGNPGLDGNELGFIIRLKSTRRLSEYKPENPMDDKDLIESSDFKIYALVVSPSIANRR